MTMPLPRGPSLIDKEQDAGLLLGGRWTSRPFTRTGCWAHKWTRVSGLIARWVAGGCAPPPSANRDWSPSGVVSASKGELKTSTSAVLPPSTSQDSDWSGRRSGLCGATVVHGRWLSAPPPRVGVQQSRPGLSEYEAERHELNDPAVGRVQEIVRTGSAVPDGPSQDVRHRPGPCLTEPSPPEPGPTP